MQAFQCLMIILFKIKLQLTYMLSGFHLNNSCTFPEVSVLLATTWKGMEQNMWLSETTYEGLWVERELMVIKLLISEDKKS